MLPMRFSSPRIFAGLMVMAFNASSSGRPSFMASAAHNGRYSCGTTGESVVMAIRIPSLHRTPGVVKDLFASSNFDLWVRDGPTIAGYPLAFTCALITSPSVQWSSVTLTSNSLAIRITVRISSARCAWHFNGSSFWQPESSPPASYHRTAFSVDRC